MKTAQTKKRNRQRNTHRLLQCAMVSGVLIAGNAAYAGNVDSFGIGSRATALGGAYSATADDPFAAYYNPAGLAQITNSTVVVGSHVLAPSMSVYDLKATLKSDGSTVIPATSFDDTSSVLVVPHLGFAMPINDKLAVGLALYVPWGLDVKWDESEVGAYSSTHSWFSRVTATPTAAYKINDQWSVGAGLSLGRSEAGDEHYFFTGSPTGPAGATANFKIKTDTTDNFNWSYNLGVMYKPSKEVTLGLTYRSKTNTELSGETTVSGYPVPGSPINQTVNTELEIDHPYQIQFGVRYQPVQAVSLEFDFVRTNWSSIGSYTAKFDAGLVLLGGATSRTYERDWKDTNQIRFGAEWKALDWLTLRAGYFYDPSPIPDNTFDLTWPDADKKTYSIGAGFNLNKSWTVDTVVQYTYAEKKRELGGESENLNGLTGSTATNVSMSADGELWGGGITVSYRF